MNQPPSHLFPLGLITVASVGGAIGTLLMLALYALMGCAPNPVASAATPEQKAYAVYGTFVVLEEEAARITQDPTAPDSLKAAIAQADARAQPPAQHLREIAIAYSAAQRNHTPTPDNLANALNEATTVINTFATTLHGTP